MPRPIVTINPELLKWSLPLEKSNDLEGAFFGLLSGVWGGGLGNITPPPSPLLYYDFTHSGPCFVLESLCSYFQSVGQKACCVSRTISRMDAITRSGRSCWIEWRR